MKEIALISVSWMVSSFVWSYISTVFVEVLCPLSLLRFYYIVQHTARIVNTI